MRQILNILGKDDLLSDADGHEFTYALPKRNTSLQISLY